VRVDAETRRLEAGLLGGATVQLREGPEPFRLPADDRERHGQAEHAGANCGLRRAADCDPDGERVLDGTRVDAVPLA
jgi:hypothetical protein